MMKVIVDYCIGSYERRRAYKDPNHQRLSHDWLPGLSIRQLFSDYINDIERHETELINKVRNFGETSLPSVNITSKMVPSWLNFYWMKSKMSAMNSILLLLCCCPYHSLALYPHSTLNCSKKLLPGLFGSFLSTFNLRFRRRLYRVFRHCAPCPLFN
ncbi:hypothetical protein F4804DRAFT_279679 [Jackrogersella minutella]|nr:hypothetical protein F4804DRAFT_279679 [Jackrogersella minutella]